MNSGVFVVTEINVVLIESVFDAIRWSNSDDIVIVVIIVIIPL